MTNRAFPLALCVIVAAAGAWPAGKAAPVSNPLVTVGFNGQPGDGLLGDTLGNYAGGTVGVKAELQVNGNTPSWSGFANLLLNVSAGGKSKRYLLFNYPAPADTPCGALATAPSRTNVKTSGILNVHSIGAIAPGEVRAVRAYLFGPDGEFGWGGSASVKCAGILVAYRADWNHWYVSTDVARLGLATFNKPGIQKNADGTIPDCTRNPCSVMGYRGEDSWGLNNGGTLWETPSGVNQLGFTTGFIANYDMPLAIMVTSTDTRLNTWVKCGQAYGCSFPY